MSNVLKVSLQTTMYSLAPTRMVAAAHCEGVGDQPGNGRPVFAAAKARPLRTIGFEDGEAKTSHSDPRR